MANSFSSAIISASSHNPVSHTVCNYIQYTSLFLCHAQKIRFALSDFATGGNVQKKDNGGEGEKGPDKKVVVAKYS